MDLAGHDMSGKWAKFSSKEEQLRLLAFFVGHEQGDSVDARSRHDTRSASHSYDL